MTRRHLVHSRHRSNRRTPTLQLASLGVAFVAFLLLFPVNAAVAAAESLYLAGTGVPEASLDVPAGRPLAVKVVVGDDADDVVRVWSCELSEPAHGYPCRHADNHNQRHAPHYRGADNHHHQHTSTTTTTAAPTTTTSTTTTTAAPTTTTTSTTLPAAASGASGGQPSNDAPSDIALAALLDPAEAAILRSEVNSNITGDFLEGLDLVVSPPIATALVSPFLVLEAFARALSDAGQALALPGLLLAFGVLYLSNEARVKALLTRDADPEGEHR